MPLKLFTLGQIATQFGCQLWQVRRLFQRGLFPEVPRVGQSRVVEEKDLPQIEKALRDAGYVKDKAPVV